MTAKPRRASPKPWSMKWIMVAIIVFVAGYTVVNFYYRKPGRAYRPYQDAQDRATTARLLAAGWEKIHIDTRRPAEAASIIDSPAAIKRDYLGIGADLESKFAEKPKLLATIQTVVAPNAVLRGLNYSFYFTGNLSDLKEQLGDLDLYHKGNELVLIPSTEPLPGSELSSRWNNSNYWVSFSTDHLEPGTYEMKVTAKGPAAVWSFKVH